MTGVKQPEQREPRMVPELEVTDLDRSLAFYVDVVGFRVRYDRPEDRFAYLAIDDLHLMLEQISFGERQFHTAPREYPFGRGMNLQMEIDDVDPVYERVLACGAPIVIPIEERWYRRDAVELGNRQFVVADPDGYRLRFFTDLGERSVTP
jgi:catechol 2,3-dioxygenase-like lactoylglutathione lyase family enzyme